MSSYYPSFKYLGINSRDKGLVVAHFDADQGESETFLNMEPIYTESADGSRRLDYGAKYSNVATFRITTVKPDGSDLSVGEIREHLKWLTGFKQNSTLDLVEHFAEEFTGNGVTTSFKLANTGAGKNILDCAKMYSLAATKCKFLNEATIRVCTETDGFYQGMRSPSMTLKAGITYTLSLDVTEIVAGDICFGFMNESNQFVSSTTITSTGHYVNRITPKEDMEVFISVLVTLNIETSGDATFKNLQLEIGSTNSQYTPYEPANDSNHIFSIYVNGVKMEDDSWIYDYTTGLVTLPSIPRNGAIVKIIYNKIKYSFIGRITNAWQYKMDARTVGLIFEFTSISPWAYSTRQVRTAILEDSRIIAINNKTDDLYGYTAMNVVFQNTTGDSLTIANTTINETTTVSNIAKNEIVTISDNMMIMSDNSSKVFGNSFNFIFPRLTAGKNVLSITGIGTIRFEYVYCMKIGDCAMDINAASDPVYDENYNVQVDTLSWHRIVDTPTTYTGYGITDVYSKEEVDQLLANIQTQVSNIYSSLLSKFDNIYTKLEIDAMFNNVYSKTEVDRMLTTNSNE